MIRFDAKVDRLISTGDLVNRGDESLETLRFCMGLGKSFKMVLGNHDLHLLAIAHGCRVPSSSDTLDEVLSAPDLQKLMRWLKQQPLLLDIGNYTLVHAGIPPNWSLDTARRLALEISSVLQSRNLTDFLEGMYSNKPDSWSESLSGPARWRAITNYLTRMRRCTSDGKLEFCEKSATTPDYDPYTGCAAWFKHHSHLCRDRAIIFGHWSALHGRNLGQNLFPLDTGFSWGGRLRIMNLENKHYVHYKALP